MQFAVDVANLSKDLSGTEVIVVCVAYRHRVHDRRGKGESWPTLRAFAQDFLTNKAEDIDAFCAEIAAAVASADRAVSAREHSVNRKKAVDLRCRLAKKVGLKGTKTEIYLAARQDRSEFSK